MDRESFTNRRACDTDRSAIERAVKRPRRAQTAHHRRMEEVVDITMDSPEVPSRSKEPQSAPESRSSSRMSNADLRARWGEAGPSPGQMLPSSTEEPIRWNRVRRRSSSRAVRPPTDTPSGDDDVSICPPLEEAKYRQAECSRAADVDVDVFGDCSSSAAFDPLSLASFGSRRPPSLPAALQGSARGSRWAVEPAPPPPCQQDAPPTVLERSIAPAMYHHLPHRTRHHRPYEPFDTALHHHSTRSTVHAPARQEHTSEAVQRRTTREASQQGNTALDVVLPPTMPRRHARRMPTSEELAERLTDRRRREEARDAIFNARAEEAELRFRMEELEALENTFADWEGGPGASLPPLPAEYQNWRTGPASSDNIPRPRAPEARGRRRGWGPESLAEAMMGMLGEDAMLGSAEGRLPHPPSHIASHLSAMRAAFAGMSSGRLPPHLLFSDRDFNEDDYEALLALDETVENRKGASKDMIEAIPTVPVPLGGLTEAGDRRCPICLEDYVSGVTLRRLHCSHQFHKPCLDKWLEQKATCPICQGDCKAGCSP
ncbi:hypothetical protein ABBQ32_002454 [Trebouxia sp. C0010 RCD-2024]